MSASKRGRILGVRDRPLPGLPGGLRELNRHFRRHGIPRVARRLILRAFEGPVRRVGGGSHNVVVRFPSRKMGVTIQAESRTVEFAYVYLCEHSPKVILFLCQPCRLPVRIVNSKGNPHTIRYGPDFLVLDDKGFHLVECKSLKELADDSAAEHPRFVHEDGKWRWPAAEEAAAKLKLGFRVFTSEEVNPLWVRNVQFLSDFVDVDPAHPAEVPLVLKHVRANPSVLVDDLLRFTEVHPDTVWSLVANGKLSADLESDRLWEINGARIHDCYERMLAARHLAKPKHSPAWIGPTVVTLEVGSLVSLWDEHWKVLHRNEKHLVLQNENADARVVHLPIADVETLLRNGALRSNTTGLVDEIRRAREEKVLRASPTALAEAAYRSECVSYSHQHGEPPEGVDERSIRRYEQWIQEGERDYGVGYLGFIRSRGRKPGERDMDPETAALLEQVVAEFSDPRVSRGIPKAKRVTTCHARLSALCDERGLIAVPHLETVRREIAKQPVARVVAAQKGARAGYQHESALPTGDLLLPVHGDRALQKAHIDHVLVKVLLVSSTTGAAIGMAWLTVIIDSFSRMPLAFSLSFNAPSAESVISTVLDCVHRRGRLPDEITADQANEFHSIRVESGLAKYKVTKSERPAGKPRFGTLMERLFAIANPQMFDEMKGSTKLRSLDRNLSPSHRPDKHAVWTLPMLYDACNEWLFEIYPTRSHRNLPASPQEIFSLSLARSGERVARYVAYDLSLRISLAPHVDRGGKRVVDEQNGIHVGYLYFWHPLFARGDVAGRSVEVKIDLVDAATAFAFVLGEWRVCHLREQAVDLSGRSWKQIKFAVQELQAHRKAGRAAKNDRINTRKIGEFLSRLDLQGKLAEQIMFDRERLLIDVPRPEPGNGAELRLVSNNPLPSPIRRDAISPPRRDARPGNSDPDASLPDDFEDLEPFDVD